jgi:hypothetical protein
MSYQAVIAGSGILLTYIALHVCGGDTAVKESERLGKAAPSKYFYIYAGTGLFGAKGLNIENVC